MNLVLSVLLAASILAETDAGRYPVFDAVIAGDTQRLHRLLQLGADPTSGPPVSGGPYFCNMMPRRDPFSTALRLRNEPVCRLLFDQAVAAPFHPERRLNSIFLESLINLDSEALALLARLGYDVEKSLQDPDFASELPAGELFEALLAASRKRTNKERIPAFEVRPLSPARKGTLRFQEGLLIWADGTRVYDTCKLRGWTRGDRVEISSSPSSTRAVVGVYPKSKLRNPLILAVGAHRRLIIVEVQPFVSPDSITWDGEDALHLFYEDSAGTVVESIYKPTFGIFGHGRWDGKPGKPPLGKAESLLIEY